MPLQDYPTAEFSPRKLSKEEIENPRMVIENFFDFAHLPQIRKMYWELLKVMVCGNWNSLDKPERTDMVYFFEKLEKIIEAVHIIFKQNKPV
jgi:hypothetical protein